MASPASTLLRRVRLFPVLLWIFAGLIPWAQTHAAQGTAVAGTPVLVELFTSEGCSDCPPADALLARLDATQFVPGAHAIVLSAHVTYWNHLGWRDPFSFDAMTERQEQYVQRFGLNSAYTPQMVVDGAVQFVGSRVGELESAVAHEAATQKLPIAIADAHWTGGTVRFAVHTNVPAHAVLYAVLAQDATHSEVARGENAGRTLHHVAVVRVMKEYGTKAAEGEPIQLSAGDKIAGPLRLVVFVADRKTGHVLGVAEQTLRR